MARSTDSFTLAVSLWDCFGSKSPIALAEIMEKGDAHENSDEFRRERTQSREPRQSAGNRAFAQQRFCDSCHVRTMMRQRQPGYFDAVFVGSELSPGDEMHIGIYDRVRAESLFFRALVCNKSTWRLAGCQR
jgi:hypothetical protein